MFFFIIPENLGQLIIVVTYYLIDNCSVDDDEKFPAKKNKKMGFNFEDYNLTFFWGNQFINILLKDR
jgi:hypothetical protein